MDPCPTASSGPSPPCLFGTVAPDVGPSPPSSPFGPCTSMCGCALIRLVHVDEDADLERAADGADHDGADEGADARLVDADRVGDRLVVGFDDVALLALRDCAAVMRGVTERRDGDADGEREKSRRAGDADEEQIVTRIVTRTEVTLRSYHDNGSVRRGCYRLTKEDATRKLRACSRNAFSRNVPPGTRTRGHEPDG
jgi:hypothetical protein